MVLREWTISGLGVGLLGSAAALAVHRSAAPTAAPPSAAAVPATHSPAAVRARRVPVASTATASATAEHTVPASTAPRLRLSATPLATLLAARCGRLDPSDLGASIAVRQAVAPTAIGHVLTGDADLALVDALPSPEQRGYGAMHQPLGQLVVAVVVGPRRALRSLTAAQARALLTGEIADWSRLGAEPRRVRLLCQGGRELAGVYSELFARGAPLRDAQFVADPRELVERVAGDAAAIGVVALSGLDPYAPVLTVAIGGVTPSLAAFRLGEYAFGRHFHVVYRNRPDPSVARVLAALRDRARAGSVGYLSRP